LEAAPPIDIGEGWLETPTSQNVLSLLTNPLVVNEKQDGMKEPGPLISYSFSRENDGNERSLIILLCDTSQREDWGCRTLSGDLQARRRPAGLKTTTSLTPATRQ
jgi:hypothetical protein